MSHSGIKTEENIAGILGSPVIILGNRTGTLIRSQQVLYAAGGTRITRKTSSVVEDRHRGSGMRMWTSFRAGDR